MCGLFGANSSFLSSSEVEDTLTLAYLSRYRGKDATGIAMINKDKKKEKKLNFALLKETVPAGFFVDHPETAHFIKSVEKPMTILGHTRAATAGALTKLNAQPFIHGHIIGAHNGVMDSYRNEKNDWSDSNLFYETLSKEGFEEAIKKAHKSYNCAYALTWIDLKSKTLHVVRNKERPLWKMTNSNATTVVWASDPLFLEFMSKRSVSVWNSPVSFAIDLEYRLDLYTRVWTTHPIPKKEEKKFYPLNTGTSSYPYRAWDWNDTPPWERDAEARREWIKKKKAEKAGEKRSLITAANSMFRGNQKKPENHHVVVLEVKQAKPAFVIKDDETKHFTYFGRDEKSFTLPEIKPHLECGCAMCTNVAVPQDTVYWFDAENYVCEECYKNPVTREIAVGDRPYNETFHKSRILANFKK